MSETQARHAKSYPPDSSDSNVCALWVDNERLEQLEQRRHVRLKPLNDVLKDREEDEGANFTMRDAGRGARLLEKGKKLVPLA